MNRLDAVNEILSAVGVRPVDALDTDGTSLSAEAERWLDRELLRIQSQGWHYNIRKDVTYSPAEDGYIYPANEIIWVDSDQDDSTTDICLVGGRIYNRDDNTFTFTDDIKIRDCTLWDFACVPHPVRDYILKSAAYRFARAVRRELRLDPGVIRDIQEDLLLAQTAAHQFDNDSSNDNMLEFPDSQSVKGQNKATFR